MPKQIITSSLAPTSGATPGIGSSPLAQAIRFGNMLFISGTGSVDPASGAVVDGDMRAQTLLALRNLTAVLSTAGATLANVVNLRVTLRHESDAGAFGQALGEFFGTEAVTMTCIGGVPNRDGVNVQIDCIAMFDT